MDPGRSRTAHRALVVLAALCMAGMTSACGGLRGVEVDVSLYSGLESPTIRVDRDTHSDIIECLDDAEVDPSAELPGHFGIPAFMITDGDVGFTIGPTATERSGGDPGVLIGCEDSYSQLQDIAEGQLDEDEMRLLDEDY